MFGMKGMGDMMKLLAQKDKIAANIETAKEKARVRTVTADSGAGMVKATANGMGEIIRIEYDAEALKDGETLGALTCSAVNAAVAKSREIMSEEIGQAMGGIEVPPGLFQ